MKLLKWINLVSFSTSTQRRDYFKKNPYIDYTGKTDKLNVFGKYIYKNTKKEKENTGSELVWQKEISGGKTKKKSKKLGLGPASLNIKAKAALSYGVTMKATLSQKKLSASFGPFAAATANASAKVGGKIASAGVKGNATLVRNELPLSLNMDFDVIEKNKKIDALIDTYLSLDNILTLPKGKIYAYAKIDLWLKTIKKTKTLFKFSTKKINKNIMKKKLKKYKLSVSYE